MKWKNKFDLKSIKFKLWFYFIGFAMILIILIWGLQIFFLENFYEEMKKDEISKLANQIVKGYQQEDYNLYAFTDMLNKVSSVNEDVYIRVETCTGENVISPSYNSSGPVYRYSLQIEQLRASLLSNTDFPFVSMITHSPTIKNSRTLGYACFLHRSDGYQDLILYVFSPLYPVQSTVSIMRIQLIYITLIATALALALALYLASRISKPIKDITSSAAEMGKGHYSVQFNGGQYTELIELADTLSHASRELEKTDMYQKDLIANVSHDLRTPLTMIKSYAEMIRDLSGNNPQKRDSHLTVIIEEADRLNALVTDMLNLSRMQNKTIQLDREDFDLQATLESLLPSYNLLCEQEGYTIKYLGAGPFLVNGDESRIKQVLSNLINNAVKYCGEDKEIQINLRRVGRKVRCEVIDHGKGIAPDEINHVWERYYKSSTHHVRTTDGSGLGLSIVREILTLHKASYGVSSKLDAGSTFWFEMDLIRPKK